MVFYSVETLASQYCVGLVTTLLIFAEARAKAAEADRTNAPRTTTIWQVLGDVMSQFVMKVFFDSQFFL